MRNEDRPFQAGQIYEQIELLSSARSRQEPLSSDARLISQLHQVYSEDREIETYVWEKLNARTRADRAQGSKQTLSGRQITLVKETSSARYRPRANRPRRVRTHLLELSVALLLVSALVVSMVVLLQRSPRLLVPIGRTTVSLLATLSPEAIAQASLASQASGCSVSYPTMLAPPSEPTSPAIFYLTGEGGYQSAPVDTSLIRYDLGSGKTKTLVHTKSDSDILAVWLSPDRQWLLLRESVRHAQKSVFQVIRTDGSMLQTVYESCTTGDVGAWSPDGRKIAFTEPATSISVLDLASGRLQRFPLGSGLVSYQPAFWADNQHLLVERSSPIDDSQIEVDLLDMSEGTEQTAHKVTSITSIPTFCGQIAPGEHGSQLFRSSCTPFGGYCHGRQVQGPSNVSVLPATGGTVRTVYSSPSRAVTAIAYAGSSSLLIYIETTSGDLSQNGLWKINTDGSDLTRLTATKVLTCQYTQYAYPLTQVSSDGARYALLYMDEGEQKLIVGSLAGGSSTTISAHQFSNVNILLLVGMGIF